MADKTRGRNTVQETDPSSVWLGIYEHSEGREVWVCRSDELAYRELARACGESWDWAYELDRMLVRGERRELPEGPPPDDRLLVDLYFEVMEAAEMPELFSIAAHEVICEEGQAR
jgi:hypothetical protein